MHINSPSYIDHHLLMSNSTDPSNTQQSFLSQNDIVQIQAMIGQTASEYMAEGTLHPTSLMKRQLISFRNISHPCHNSDIHDTVSTAYDRHTKSHFRSHKGLRGSISRQFSLGIIVILLLSSLIGFSADLALFINVITMLGLQPASPMLLSQLDAIVNICSRVNVSIASIVVKYIEYP